jgi:hypothetical protein
LQALEQGAGHYEKTDGLIAAWKLLQSSKDDAFGMSCGRNAIDTTAQFPEILETRTNVVQMVATASMPISTNWPCTKSDARESHRLRVRVPIDSRSLQLLATALRRKSLSLTDLRRRDLKAGKTEHPRSMKDCHKLAADC